MIQTMNGRTAFLCLSSAAQMPSAFQENAARVAAAQDLQQVAQCSRALGIFGRLAQAIFIHLSNVI